MSASRRLDISSLLCDDPPAPPQRQQQPPQHQHQQQQQLLPEPIILAPHLAVRSYATSPYYQSPTAYAPPPSPSSAGPSSSFQALVHAAAFERSRLSATSPTDPHQFPPPTTPVSPPVSSHRPSHSPRIVPADPQPQPQPQLQIHSHPHRPWELDNHPRPSTFTPQPQPPAQPRHDYFSPIAPSFHTSGRKSDPGHLVSPILSPPVSEPLHKRRHSGSPTVVVPNFKSPEVNPEPLTIDIAARTSSSSPRRPGSGYDRRQSGGPEPSIIDRQRISVAALSAVTPEFRGREPHRLPRRSPPGSLIGRAKAARKLEEVEAINIIASPQPVQHIQPIKQPEPPSHQSFLSRPAPSSSSAPLRTSPVLPSPSTSSLPTMIQVPLRPPSPPPPRLPSLPPPQTTVRHQDKPQRSAPPREVASHRSKRDGDDAHSWFLEQLPGPDPSPSTLRRPSPPVSPKAQIMTPILKYTSPIVSTMPDAATALEEELEALLPSNKAREEASSEMLVDDDQVVDQLVAEALEEEKSDEAAMEVDVDNELLSLVEDGPSQPKEHARPLSTHKPASPTTLSIPLERLATPRLVTSEPMTATLTPSEETPELQANAASATKKKKEAAPKTASKPRAPAKPKAKPQPKGKTKAESVQPTAPPKVAKTLSNPVPKKSSPLATSRSRSASVKPSGQENNPPPADHVEQPPEPTVDEDEKVYCLCNDGQNGRSMIACDRCDEWYHAKCVQIRDVDMHLVDKFFCPPCIQKYPQLSLRTTYKPRCLYGLKHPAPDSAQACHEPSRGHLSKYCSDECGVSYMQTRIDAWTKKGGKREKLWESVKNVERRESSTVCLKPTATKLNMNDFARAKRGKVDREIARLNQLLDKVVKLREEIKKGMEVVHWREKLLELAKERAEQVGLCGWDQRLCFGDEEWADFGAEVLESYEESKPIPRTEDDEMEVDGGGEEEGEWWCPGGAVCERHAGWQTIRFKEICKEKEKKEEGLFKLTTKEREIRKRIEDIMDPHNCKDPPNSPLRLTTNKPVNGHAKGRANVETVKKGKKRKAQVP
ncbi:hypothetical protein BDN72DRAFT_24762 [Pluteus cervinus]|uniref:Uncharacterized protein n=1 Tax=Pluteus cervinus TaxID=181527 RepID=A0ACD3BG95_9AGAR|nr:hypothetical protein BDN72DRAFT_24762 [Pluteus cervinus]